jgi:hypothetical protein
MANAALNANKALSPRNSKHEYLLASAKDAPLLRCRICHRAGREHMMGGRTRPAHENRGERNQYYECYHWQDGERVRHRVAAKRLEDAVWDALCAMIHNPKLVLARFRQLSDHASREAQEITAKIAALSEAENENRLAQKRLIDLASRGRLAADLIDEQERNLAREAAEITSKKTLLETQLEQAAAGQAPLRDVQDACALLADGLLEAGFEEKQWLIRHLVQVIYADKEGWTLEGRLPGMRAEGSFTGGAIEEQSL